MENHTIYMITHIPTGLFYIGRTMQDPRLRYAQHIIRALTTTKRTKFHEVIFSSDINDFRLDILETNIPTVDQAIVKEKYYIELYHACEIGLNSDPHATGFRYFSEEFKNNVTNSYMSGYSIESICRYYNMSTTSAIKILKEKLNVDHIIYRGLTPVPFYIDLD